MQLRSTFFDSGVALRIALVFVAAAALPLLVFGWLFAREATDALEEQAFDQLANAARSYGRLTLERLVDADAAIPDPDALGNSATRPRAVGTDAAIAIRPDSQELLYGDWIPPGNTSVTPGTLSTLRVLPTPQSTAEVVIGRRHDATIVLARLDPAYLWNADLLLNRSMEVCVLTATTGAVVYCSSPLPTATLATLWAGIAEDRNGHTRWSNGGDEWLSAYWELFLPSRFSAEPWTLVVSQPRNVAIEGLDAFTHVLPRVGILTILLVGALALSQIRRTLTPLRELMAGTERIAAQNFTLPVRIERADEFGKLGTAVNSMADQLRQQFGALRALTDVDRLILETAEIGTVVDTVLARLQALRPTAEHLALVIDGTDDEHGRIYRSRADAELPRERVSVSRSLRDWLATAPLGITSVAELRAHGLAFSAWPPETTLAVAPMQAGDTVVGALFEEVPPDSAPADRDLTALREFAARITVAITAGKREAELFRRAHFDALTELPNRELLDDRLRQAVAQAQREDHRLAVLFVDLDGFKAVNDTLGHRAGDELLKETGLRLSSVLRDADTVARLGGDEYALVLPRIHGPLEAESVAIKALRALSAAFAIDERQAFVTASIGIALFPDDGSTAEDLLRKADMAMYSAKDAGKACYRFFAQEMDRQIQERHALHHDLRNALFAGELFLVYQPQIAFRTQSYVCAEALLRWRHPTRGLVSPGVFIPILEETDLINAVGTWVLRRALAEFGAWRKQGLSFERVAVNVSARQLLDPNFVDIVLDALADAKLEGHHLEVELTEASLVEDFKTTNVALSRLVEHGVHVALDDFGTGYSSLAYLNELVFDTLKIDRAFVINLPAAKAAAIVRAIIAVATALGKSVVAEGIESEQQYRLLDALGCDIGQGYLLSKPLDGDALVSWARTRTPGPRIAAGAAHDHSHADPGHYL